MKTEEDKYCYHLYVEFKKYDQLMNVTEKKLTQREQIGGYQ